MAHRHHTVAGAFPTILVAIANRVLWKQMRSCVRAMANATTGCPATERVHVTRDGGPPTARRANPYSMGLNASHAQIVQATARA